MIIRAAWEDDIPAIAAIYAVHVRESTATFELEPPGVAEMACRLAGVLGKELPWLVAEREGRIAGYAYADRYRTRPAYHWTLEDSIYLDPEYTGQDIGRQLLQALIGECQQAGYRQLIAVIGDSSNQASIGLHAVCGFRYAGILQSVGFKFGRWIDTVFMQRALGAGDMIFPDREETFPADQRWRSDTGDN